jgi:menaquinone-dependent protoporphyrinogen oxidase
MREDPPDVAVLLTVIRARGHRMFAGKLDPENLSLPQRAALMVFRGMRGDFRDWTAIRQWAGGIVQQLAALSPR